MEEKKGIILALDISTTTIGVCLMLDDGSQYGKIIELTHINPKVPNKTDKIEALFLKTEIFRNEFLKKYKDFGITKVIIEAPLLRSNNINTAATLLQFNGMISLAVFEELGVKANYISSYDARKYSFPDLMSIRKYGKDGKEYDQKKIVSSIKKSSFVLFGSYPFDIDKKNVMHGKITELFPDIPWIYDKKGELKKENFDATDAYVAALGFMNKKRYGELEMTSSNVRVEGNRIDFDVKYWGSVEHRVIYTEKG